MPPVLKVEGFRFYFYSNEHVPPHIHVSKGETHAIVVLSPDIHLEKVNNMKTQDLKKTFETIEETHILIAEKTGIHRPKLYEDISLRGLIEEENTEFGKSEAA